MSVTRKKTPVKLCITEFMMMVDWYGSHEDQWSQPQCLAVSCTINDIKMKHTDMIFTAPTVGDKPKILDPVALTDTFEFHCQLTHPRPQ